MGCHENAGTDAIDKMGQSAPSNGQRLMQRRIVAVGECMVELSAASIPGQYAMGFAGDTLNTAWYLRRCLGADWQIDYVTAIGQDALSDRMASFLAEAGLGTALVRRVPDRTVGLYLIELTDGERSFAYWRGQSAARLLAADVGRLKAALAGAALIYLSGITLAILEGTGRANLLTALRHARAAGSKVAFDPNLRPRLWPDSATMCAALMEAAAVADILLPSHEDEATHFGDRNPLATATRYGQAGAALVVVKNGPGEMVLWDRGQITRLTPDPVAPVIDTTAAGDSFNAAFLAAHLTGAGLLPSAQAGAALAAKVIGARGALVSV